MPLKNVISPVDRITGMHKWFSIVDQHPHAHAVVDRHDEISDPAKDKCVFPRNGIMKMFKRRSQILCVEQKGCKNKDNHGGHIDSHVRMPQGAKTKADVNIPE